jgi:rhombotail lipoprotein
MKAWYVAATLLLSSVLCGCAVLDETFCAPRCQADAHNSSSLVDFLYPDGQTPPRDNAMPQLRVPLRVGLAFLPSSSASAGASLDAAHRERLLERIRERFKDRRFVAEIVTIPDYYLASSRGFAGLEAVQRLYSIDLMALVSYDQVMHEDDNRWSLGYLTIVGAYVLKGTRHDVSTLVDLAVVDPATRSLVLRAGGTDTRDNSSTLIDAAVSARSAGNDGFSAATDQMIAHFDAALTDFEGEVRAGKASVRVVSRDAGSVGGGGGAITWPWIVVLASCAIARVSSRYRSGGRLGGWDTRDGLAASGAPQ